jgi:hypothetical protein
MLCISRPTVADLLCQGIYDGCWADDRGVGIFLNCQ